MSNVSELWTDSDLIAPSDTSSNVYNTVYESSRQQFVVEESILTALSLGTITSIFLKCKQLPGRGELKDFRVRMKHTSSSTTTAWEGDWTDCYGPTTINNSSLSVDDWYEFVFTTEFEWNGVDNILIDLSRTDTDWTSGGASYHRDVGITNITFQGRKDGSPAMYTYTSGTTSGANTDEVPALKIKYLEGDAPTLSTSYFNVEFSNLSTGTEASSERDLWLSGMGTSGSERSIWLAGGLSDSSERNLWLSGVLGDSSIRNLYLSGIDTADSKRDLWLAGGLSDSSERDLWLTGSLSDSSKRDLWLSGMDTSDSERNLWLLGDLSEDSQRDLYLSGKDTSSSERDLYLTGSLGSNSERDLWLSGGLDESSERDLWLSGIDTSDSERDLWLAGKDISSSKRDLWLIGKDISTSERDLWLSGRLSNSSERDLWLSGVLKGSSQRTLWLHGKMSGTPKTYFYDGNNWIQIV